jgi:hypothetical protein
MHLGRSFGLLEEGVGCYGHCKEEGCEEGCRQEETGTGEETRKPEKQNSALPVKADPRRSLKGLPVLRK